jgi:flagellar basal body-associated protein FliL
MRKLTWLLPVTMILFLILAATVSVSAQDDLEVRDLSISPDSVAVGEYVTITATVTNTKDTEETYSIELKLNGEVKDSQELPPLGAGQSDNVTFTMTADTPGENLVELGNASGVFSVTGQASFWNIFPSWVWIVIIAIIVVLIILVIVIVAMPSRKKQPGAAAKGRQVQPTAQAAMPFPIPSTGPTGPQIGHTPPMPTQTPETFPTPGQFPAPGPMAPYPQYARRPIFSVSNLTITPNQVKSGEPVTINAIVSNNGSDAGTYSVVLRINSVVEHITDLILTPGASQSATFTIIKDVGGDYFAEVDGLSGTFVVIPLVPANFSVSNLVISPERAKQGETISISAMVINNGEVVGNYSLVLKLKGAVETTREIELGPGESQKVTFDINKNTPGFYNVELEGLMGRFVIEMEWQG